MPKREDPNVGATVVVGVAGAILVLVIILALRVVYYHFAEEEVYRKVLSQESQELLRVTREQREKLESFGWIDKEKGVARVPIEVAMDLVVKDLAVEAASPAHGSTR